MPYNSHSAGIDGGESINDAISNGHTDLLMAQKVPLATPPRDENGGSEAMDAWIADIQETNPQLGRQLIASRAGWLLLSKARSAEDSAILRRANMADLLPDSDLINSNGKDLTWAQLAALKQRADAGDASAAVMLESLPKGAQYNANLLVKSFGGKPKKKRAKPAVVKVMKAAKPVDYANSAQRVIDGFRNSDNPATREMAKAWYGI